MDKNPPARLVWHGQEPACTTASGHAIAQPARPVCGNPARTTLSGPDDPAARTTQPFPASDRSPLSTAAIIPYLSNPYLHRRPSLIAMATRADP